MPKINVLPKSVAELIAAGEVVERPASVVKELVENSIDAGADSITVEIKNGGIRYIRVTDNGCGISREDVPLAFISHATSKIADASDLDAIMTLGFRGEAVPSIAAVSRFSILTKTPESETGTVFSVEGGEAGEVEDAGCPDGTTVTVRDLFFNTPARMKFLKKDATEGIYVGDVVTKSAIAHPEIRFTFIRDGKQILASPGSGDLYETVYAVLGKDIAGSLIKCEYEHDSIRINGFISKPLNNRPNRNYQYFYVNRRYVKIPVASVALDEGYKNSIMVGKFPMCFLNIDIPPGKTDVNVHPAKTEVRFSDERTIFEAVYYASKTALSRGDTARPAVKVPEKPALSVFAPPREKAVQYRFDTASAQSGADSVTNKNTGFVHEGSVFRDTSSVFSGINTNKPEPVGIDIVAEAAAKNTDTVEESPRENNEVRPFTGFSDALQAQVNAAADANNQPTQPLTPKAVSPEIIPRDAGGINIVTDETKSETAKILGEIFDTYILVEQGTKLLIIDKHAAHERMIFNSLKKTVGENGSQLLMFPVAVNLPAKDYVAVLENLEVFGSAGYLVEDFGGSCVVVREVPIELCDGDIKDIITEMAGKLSAGNLKPTPEKLEWLYDSTSCRAAIKAGDKMKDPELEAFVKKLLADESVKYCPHGRPVMFELTRREIEKQFGRLG